MKLSKLALLAALAASAVMPAHAVPTFQSVAVDLSNVSPSSAVGGSSTTDNLWRQRNGFGETAATILEAYPTENASISLTLSGLTAGSTYDIWVNYIRFGAGGTDPDGDRGGIRASLNGVTYTLFNAAGGTSGTVGFAELTGFSNSDRVGLRGYLGTAVANGSGEILVFADTNGAIQERAWLDGASYEASSAPPDETPPSLLATNPADDAANIPVSATFVATFDELIALGATGTVTIKNLSNPADTVISLPGPDPDGTLSVSGTDLTINPATALVAGDDYSIEIGPTVVEDISGNAYPGLLTSDDPNWTFTTDGTPPSVTGMSPMADANDVTISSNLTLSFDEDVQAGTGDITIHLASDDTVVASIDVNSGIVSVAGDAVVINPPSDLAYSTTYYVNIPAAAITDLSGNPFAGVSGTTSWRFTTAALDLSLLFADTFDRSDGSDLNASASGKSGTLAPLDWVEVKSGGEPTITSNTLRLGETGAGAGWSIAYPDHNFIDSSIASGGEFTVSVDLGATGSGGNTRFTGIAVGHSLAEVSGWSANTPASFDSDFFIGYDPTGTTEVKIFRAGQQVYQQTINLNGGATLSVRFSGISDFNSGSTVSYEAFINGGSPVATGSFFWSGTDENYIALYSNYTLMQGILDNFEVRAASGTPADPFTTWAESGTLPGTVTFEGDLNGDGVQDGIAFLLGVANPDDDATGALPAVSEDGSGGLQMVFDCLPVADRGGAELYVQHSSDLSTWTPSPTGVEVPDTSGGPTSNITFSVAAGSPLNTVTATIDLGAAAGGKLFGRLAGTE